jgi:hypothetical protein
MSSIEGDIRHDHEEKKTVKLTVLTRERGFLIMLCD